MLKVYEYEKCSTCRKALSFLDKKGVRYQRIPIVEKAPSVAELRRMLGYLKENGGSLKNLFNTSGQQYRELGVSEKLAGGMTETEALKLLSSNGKLVKRPFVLGEPGSAVGVVGFKEELWKKIF